MSPTISESMAPASASTLTDVKESQAKFVTGTACVRLGYSYAL